MLLQSYGSGGYSDRRGRCQDAMGCSSQRDGALRLSEVGSQHARGDRSATADCIGHSVGQLNEGIGAYSDRSGRCRDGMVQQCGKSVGVRFDGTFDGTFGVQYGCGK